MDFIILEQYPIINGVEETSFLYVLELNESNINVNVANSEYTFSIPISSNNIEAEVNDFFSVPREASS